MKPTIKIDFVSDIACPWCAVGLGNLQKGLDQLKEKANFELHFRPFELNPTLNVVADYPEVLFLVG